MRDVQQFFDLIFFPPLEQANDGDASVSACDKEYDQLDTATFLRYWVAVHGS